MEIFKIRVIGILFLVIQVCSAQSEESEYFSNSDVFENNLDGLNTTSENDETSTLENDETSVFENDETTTSENDESTTSENDETSTLENDETSTLENDETSIFENGEPTTSENDETTTSENDETTTSENDETTISENDETTTFENVETTTSVPPGSEAINGTDCICHQFIGKCDCYKTYGVIGFPSRRGGAFNFTFNVSDGNIVMIRFKLIDITQKDDKDCSLLIGDQEIVPNVDYLEEENFFYLTTPEIIKIGNNGEGEMACEMHLKYSAVPPNYYNTYVTELEGTITGPIDSEQDSPNADLGYMEQIRINYQFLLPENYVTEFTITELNLGYRGDPVNSEYSRENTVKNDLLLIGIEDETGLQLDNYLFFGLLNGTVKVKVVSPNAYVAFAGSYHENKPTGFKINHKSYFVTPGTTVQTISTTTMPNFGAPATGFIPLDSATKGFGTTAEMEEVFKKAMAELATEYVARVHINMADPQNITAEDIIVNEVVDCLPNICNDYCAAFDFSILKFNSDHSAWAFDEENLDRMIYDEEAAVYWKIIGDECQYCDENVQVNWLVVGFGCLFIFIIVLVIIGFAWHVSQEKSAKQRREDGKLNTELDEREWERRQSDDRTMLGQMKGGMRISLPFASRRNSSITSAKTVSSEMDYDTSGFVDVDTDIGYETFGLGSELVGDPSSRSFYGNPAFVPDSPTQKRKYQQLLQQTDVPKIDFMSPSTSTNYNSVGFSLPPPISIPLKSSLKKPQKPEKTERMGNLTTFQEESEDDETEFYSKSPKRVLISAEVHNDIDHQTAL